MGFSDHPNVRAHGEVEEGPVGEVSQSEQWVVDKLTHVLSIYPKVSVSMLQVGIGTSVPPALWKPIMEKMINDGRIKRELRSAQTPEGRGQTYTIISLGEASVKR